MKPAHSENRHVLTCPRINCTLYTYMRRIDFEPVIVFFSCIKLSLTAKISYYSTHLHTRRWENIKWFGKIIPQWIQSFPVIPLTLLLALISQWTDLIRQMPLLQASSPGWEDCQRHKVREVGLTNIKDLMAYIQSCLYAACNQMYCISTVPRKT